MDKQGPPPSYHQPGFTPAQTYQPGPPPSGPAIIVTTSPGISTTQVGPTPSRVTCPSCRAEVQTKLKHEATTKTHLMALALCCFLCWPCVCLPYCMDSCQNSNHYCPNCDAFIGTYHS